MAMKKSAGNTPRSSEKSAAKATSERLARIDLKRLAEKLQKALNERDRTERSVILSTLALEGQGADFDWRIAEELKAHAWDGLYGVYSALHEAMRLIPEGDRPEGFKLDTGALPIEVPAGAS